MSDAPVLAGVNRVADIDAAGDFEKKHTPKVVCVREGDMVRVSVTIGHGIAHPNLADHFIEWIHVLANGAPVYTASFAAVATAPSVECVLAVEPGTAISAIESCNLHGVWAYDVTAP